MDYAEYAVRSAEQLYTQFENEQKKEYVYNYICDKVSELQLDLDHEDVNILVEGLVNAIKHGSNE